MRNITIMEVTTHHVENMKTCSGSFWDAIDMMDASDLTPSCSYAANSMASYDDKYWHYDIGEQFGITDNIYGLQSYYL
jgi:hypothetical protein